MKRAVFAAVAMVCLLALGASAQTATTTTEPAQPVTQTWSTQVSAVALPGGKNSIAGTDAGITFTPSPNLDLFDRNLLSSDQTLQYYAGGVNYRFPAISVAANNASQNVNFLRVQFFATGSVGVAKVSSINHYGFTAGGGVNYQLTSGGAWTLGGKAEYAHFPGYPGSAIVEMNAAFHF